MKILERYRSKIEEEIRHFIFKDQKAATWPFYQMMAYHFGWQGLDKKKYPALALSLIDQLKGRGKAFRPTLMLLINEHLGGDYLKALPAAASLEIFHNFSLIHDDIEDHDEYRRGKPTLWKIWGPEQAINVGDGMFALSQLAALKLFDQGIAQDRVIEVLKILNESFLEVTEGQYLDLSFEENNQVKVSDYLTMIRKKTAVLIAAACQIGALLASDDQKTIQAFRDFGLNLGMAYQLFDDVAGIWGDFASTGKKEAGDLRKKKKTLPLIYAFSKLPQKSSWLLSKLLKQPQINDQEIKTIINLLDQVKAKDFTLDFGERYWRLAFKAIKNLNLSPAFQNDLNQLLTEIRSQS